MNIHEEVDHILSGLDFEEKQQPTLKQRLRAFLAEDIGEEWRKCTLLSHRLPDGRLQHTASRLCLACGTIHTFVLFSDGDSFDIASPSPVMDDQEGGAIC